MFWSANYMSTRQLNFFLKEENVTLTQILEADDILQECKADNKDLIRFLTRPEILKELITLITEEPSKDVELTTQYRHSNIACEVLTSPLSGLMSSLCMDVEQMNRLCDFLNQDPPLNPLLASYFSRTIETLLKRSPMQDCYLHHILCLRALDFFKARKDFLPNLLRHIATSAIADTIKYFIFYLEEPFSEIIKEWLDEHAFLENLIQIICCEYEPEEIQVTPVCMPIEQKTENNVEKGVDEESEKAETSHKDSNSSGDSDKYSVSKKPLGEGMSERTRRLKVAASSSASALACGIADEFPGEDRKYTWTTRYLSARLRTKPLAVNGLLLGCFCSPAEFQDTAMLNGCRLLRALIKPSKEFGSVELRALTPHLRLLQQALLREPSGRRRVGAARLQVAALVADLVATHGDAVHAAMRKLNLAGELLDMFYAFPDNNFLHAQVCTMLRNIAQNNSQAPDYWMQLAEEGNLLTRLMDTFEENEDKKTTRRSSLMGHVTLACRTLAAAGVGSFATPEVRERWEAFLQTRLQPLLTRLDAPLGGEYPSETSYKVGNTESDCDYTFEASKEGVSQIDADNYGDDMWDDGPINAIENMKYSFVPPWEQRSGWGDEEKNEDEGGVSLPEDEGWAQFGSETSLPPVDPFAPQDPHSPWSQNVAESSEQSDNMCGLQAGFKQLQLDGAAELTHNLLSALSGLAPHHLAQLADTASQLTDPPTCGDSNSANSLDATPQITNQKELEKPDSDSKSDLVNDEISTNINSSEVGKSDPPMPNEVGNHEIKMSNDVGKPETEVTSEIKNPEMSEIDDSKVSSEVDICSPGSNPTAAER